MGRKIEVVSYNPDWPRQYLKEIKIVKDVLSREIVKAHHIGSTAVENLAAKPVIDILLEVKDVNRLDKYNKEMEKLGYTPRGEFGIPDRRFYLKGIIERTHHIHAFSQDSLEVKRHLAFRDYLIANPIVANEYGKLKLKLAKECNNDISEYLRLKNDFIKFHEKKALEWQNNNSKYHF